MSFDNKPSAIVLHVPDKVPLNENAQTLAYHQNLLTQENVLTFSK